MMLSSGTKLGRYEIRSKLGEGGMGEVYRAFDPKIGREVAIKVLSPDFAAHKERVARFEQEAQAAGGLNHPNILAIHDVDTANNVLYVVSELLEGEELRDRLNHESVPLRKAIDYAQQIVSGLCAAHEKGIVHRDLKPENLFITKDERVKILDFGIAKLATPANSNPDISEDATRKVLTNPGMVIGTVGYMSPEQVRGEKADHRSDIFSFGAILHEMISGQRAFRRETMAETMTAILREEPEELSASNPNINPSLERIVNRCLEKKPERRFQSTADLSFALEALGPPTSSSGRDLTATASVAVAEIKKSAWRERIPWIAAGTFAIAAAVLAWGYFRGGTNGNAPMRLAFQPPKNLQFNDTQADWAVISPDGDKIAFTANTPDGKYLLYVSDLKSGQVTPLPGSENPLEPFWSPDSKSIAYGSRGKLKRSDTSGGNAQVLTDAPRLTAGAWNSNGHIVFGPDYGSAMFTVSAKGGEPRQVTVQEADGDGQHSGGTFLPDGRRFIFTRSGAAPNLRGLWLASLDSKETKRLSPEVLAVRFAPPDWLITVRNKVLVAQKIDLNTAELKGEPIPIITDTASAPGPARFSVSANGVLEWQGQWQRKYQLRYFDSEGKQTGAIGNVELVSGPTNPHISPDGKQVVYQSPNGVLVSDLAGNNPIKLVGATQLPIWSPDGSKIAFNGNLQDVGRGILQQPANGVGKAELLLSGTVFSRQYSPDGRFLMYWKRGATTRWDVWLHPLTGETKEIPLLASPADEFDALISPNGKWLAYISDESGEGQLYVQSFKEDGTLGTDRKRISPDGASRLAWGRDGRQLFYIQRDGQMMSLVVRAGAQTFENEPPKALFATRTMFGYGFAEAFDVTPDGKFLIGTLVGEPTSPAPTIILNWQAAMKQ
jgi:eukaryotic-like serine/threonine-protein kinase